MIEPADLQTLVSFKFKVADLKELLKDRGMRTTGPKDELVRRLVENDAAAMREATRGVALLRCTTEGAELARRYLEEEAGRRQVAESEVLRLLSRQDYLGAASVVAQFEASQVFARGLGIDWKNYDCATDVHFLKTVFERTPTILKDIQQLQLGQLRLVAGMMYLWGTNDRKRWFPEGLQTGIRLTAEVACAMLVFHASYIRELEGYRKSAVVKTVEILGAHDESSCDECRRIDGKRFQLDSVPELPYTKCTCDRGCRCTTVAAEFK